MSLYHFSDKLNHLSERRYDKGRSDIPKILEHYDMFCRNILYPYVSQIGKVITYTIIRLRLFQKMPIFTKEDMPGSKVKEQRWTDPRVEFGMRNPRQRRRRR